MTGAKGVALGVGFLMFVLAVLFVGYRLILRQAKLKNRYRSSRQRKRHQHWAIRLEAFFDRLDRKIVRMFPSRSRRRRRSRSRSKSRG